MNEKMIVDAYCRIRTIDQTIPDDVLDFMKDSAIKILKAELSEEKLFTASDMLLAAEYGYNFRANTAFPQHTFAQECINNTKQWLIAKFKIKNIWK